MIFRLTLLILLVPLLAVPAQAGIIFGRKKDKVDPKQRVPDLVTTLKTDKDADKRSAAATELRQYDPAVFPQIVPALIEALQSDSKTGVRIDAAHSLSKLRPVSPVVGEALEQTIAKDSSMRVRLQARAALLQYHWAGYRGKKAGVPPLNPTREPPLAGEQGPPAISTTASRPNDSVPVTPAPIPQPAQQKKGNRTQEPPIAPAPLPVKPETPPSKPTSGQDGPELP